MGHKDLTAQEVADFLAASPDFFESNADVFATLKVPHPYKSQAISLGERQILTLRARLKNSEAQLQHLVYNASGNQKINHSLIQWCARMLAEQNAEKIPEHIIKSLKDQFALDAIALKIWDLEQLQGSEFNQSIDDEIIAYAKSLSKPYCGSPENQLINTWLDVAPESIAIIPLVTLNKTKTIGLLVFGSTDKQRFTNDMGTDFLQLIADLAGAALSRLDTNQ